MEKRKYLFLLILLLFTITSGCNMKIDFADEEPFIITTTYPGGENYYVEFYPRNIAVYSDGTLRIYTEGTKNIVEDDAPTVEIKLTNKEVESIKKTIIKNGFFKLNEDLTDSTVEDGTKQYITVNTKTDTREVGGISPIDENFQAIWEEVLSYASEEFDEWLYDIDEYIYDKNPGPND